MLSKMYVEKLSYKDVINKITEDFNLDLKPIYLNETNKKNYFEPLESFYNSLKTNKRALFVLKHKRSLLSGLKYNYFNIKSGNNKKIFYDIYILNLSEDFDLEDIYEGMANLLFLEYSGKEILKEIFENNKNPYDLFKLYVYSSFITDLGVDYLNNKYKEYFGEVNKFNFNDFLKLGKAYLNWLKNFVINDIGSINLYFYHAIPKILGKNVRKESSVDIKDFPRLIFLYDKDADNLVENYLKNKGIEELAKKFIYENNYNEKIRILSDILYKSE